MQTAAIGTAAERMRISSVDPAFTAKTLAEFFIRSGKYRKHGKSGQDLITVVGVAQAAGHATKSDHHSGFVPLFDNFG